MTTLEGGEAIITVARVARFGDREVVTQSDGVPPVRVWVTDVAAWSAAGLEADTRAFNCNRVMMGRAG